MVSAIEEGGSALLESLTTIIRRTAPDKDKLRGMIEEVVDERMPRTLQVHSGDLLLGAIDEHTRPEFEEIALAVHSGVNVMLTGPAGGVT